MKKSFLIFFLFSCSFCCFAQQSPSDIKTIWNQCSQILQKYDEGNDSLYNIINRQITNCGDSMPEQKAIWEVSMAKFLNFYRKSNDYSNESSRIKSTLSEDYKTWSYSEISQEIVNHYLNSLKDKKILQNRSIKKYQVLLDTLCAIEFRPTLFDLLAHEALDFLTLNEYSDSGTNDHLLFNLHDPHLFDFPDKFAAMNLSSTDSLSYNYLIMKIFQDLTRLHLEANSNYPLIDISLERLQFLHNSVSLPNCDDLYFEALLYLSHKYYHKNGYENICEKIGYYYFNLNKKKNREDLPEHESFLKNAMYWYRQAIDFAPQSTAACLAKRGTEIITHKMLTIFSPSYTFANEDFFFSCHYTNCDSIQIKVVAIPPNTELKKLENKYYSDKSVYLETLLKFKSLYQTTLATPIYQDYNEHCGDILLPPLPFGEYAIIVYTSSQNEEPVFSVAELIVTNLMVSSILKKDENGNLKTIEISVTDRKTGNPVPNAAVTLKLYNFNKQLFTTKGSTNEKGFFSTSITTNYSCNSTLTVENKADRISLNLRSNSSYSYSPSHNMSFKTQLFSDRRIYRPGQTLYFKGITIQNNYPPQIAPHQKVNLSFKNSDGTILKKMEYTTNEYGSFSDSIVLPTNYKTGKYMLFVNWGEYLTFNIEEYKRPTIEITINKPQEDYRINDTVTITGKVKALAGYAIDNAQVSYRIVRDNPFSWRSRHFTSPLIEIARGSLSTDQSGDFSLSFSAFGEMEECYNFKIYLTVTDLTGETHLAEKSLFVSEQNRIINFEIEDHIDKNRSDYTFSLTLENLANIPQTGMVNYEIIRLTTPKTFLQDKPTFHNSNEYTTDVNFYDLQTLQTKIPYFDFSGQNDKTQWKAVQSVSKGSLNTDSASTFPSQLLTDLAEGYYKIKLTSTDSHNHPISSEKIIYIFDSQDNNKSAFEPLTLISDLKEVIAGQTLNIYLSSALSNAKILFEVVSLDSIIHSEWITLNQNRYHFSMNITEKHCGKLFFNAYLVQNNCIYTRTCTFDIPFLHKKLDFQFITFRNKIEPGSKEEWKIKILDNAGKPVSAEFLGSMYDASLDLLGKPNPYSFQVAFAYSNNPLRNHLSNYTYNYRAYFSDYFIFISYRQYASLNWQSFLKRNDFYNDEVLFFVEDNIEEVQTTLYEAKTGNFISNTSTETASENLSNFIRKNFSETAFFYPHLITNGIGEINLSFTIPESLTKWHFQGIAHTKDLQYGTFSRYVQTQKEFMVETNAPRFLREKDTLDFSAKIVNLSPTPISGIAQISFFDAITNEPVAMILENETQPFTCDAQISEAISFKIAVPQNITALKYRITATLSHNDSKHLQDGVEALLPVLSNRTLVTEAMPVSINANSKKNFVFEKLKRHLTNSSDTGTLCHHNLTFEFTPNPVWYAILSLPYLIEYPYDCNEQKFSRLYANMIASHVINSSPKIKQIFDQWQTSSPEVFCSQLEKNENLKNVLLEETPWYSDALTEAEKRQQIGVLFNLQKMNEEKYNTLTQLQKAQNADGGWAWFSGGYSSRYITEYILAGFGHLNGMGIDCDLADKNISKAIQFIDNEINKQYQQSDKKQTNVSLSHLHYLYARSFYLDRKKISKNQLPAYNFYLENLKNSWQEQSVYGKALSALIMYRNGSQTLAKEILQNIKNLAQYSEEMGMFWKKEGAGYYWYESPIERQALLIEAFYTINRNSDEVTKMQQWLLKQKQTQNWGTTTATAEACYALLLNNTLIEKDNTVQISIGDWHYDSSQPSDIPSEKGSGYFKKSWNQDEITDKMGSVQINNEGNSVGFGALYWQYFENIEKITPSENLPLQITKNLYKVTVDERGELLLPVESTALQVGDKIRVRMVLRSDRDMEYVHLKDMRAAALEPVNVLSRYQYQNGLTYYESTRDAATHFFIEYLPKGTYVFEYDLLVTQTGNFSNGFANIQCMYAPEFSAHSQGIKIIVK